MAIKQRAKQTEKPATVDQKTAIMSEYSGVMYQVLEKLTFKKAQQMLAEEGKKTIRKKIANYFELPEEVDEWAEEKLGLEKFWKIVFNYTINWDDFILPKKTPEFPHLNIKPAIFTAEQIYLDITTCKIDDGKKLRFKKRSKFYSNIDEAIKNAKAVQEHPNHNGNYAWADRGTAEPDACHLGKSYDDAIAKKFPFLGPVEYLLSCAEFEFRTGKVYDVKGITYLGVLDSDGDAMYGFWYDGRGSCLGRSSRGLRNPDCGPREAVYA